MQPPHDIPIATWHTSQIQTEKWRRLVLACADTRRPPEHRARDARQLLRDGPQLTLYMLFELAHQLALTPTPRHLDPFEPSRGALRVNALKVLHAPSRHEGRDHLSALRALATCVRPANLALLDALSSHIIQMDVPAEPTLERERFESLCLLTHNLLRALPDADLEVPPAMRLVVRTLIRTSPFDALDVLQEMLQAIPRSPRGWLAELLLDLHRHAGSPWRRAHLTILLLEQGPHRFDTLAHDTLQALPELPLDDTLAAAREALFQTWEHHTSARERDAEVARTLLALGQLGDETLLDFTQRGLETLLPLRDSRLIAPTLLVRLSVSRGEVAHRLFTILPSLDERAIPMLAPLLAHFRGEPARHLELLAQACYLYDLCNIGRRRATPEAMNQLLTLLFDAVDHTFETAQIDNEFEEMALSIFRSPNPAHVPLLLDRLLDAAHPLALRTLATRALCLPPLLDATRSYLQETPSPAHARLHVQLAHDRAQDEALILAIRQLLRLYP